MIKFTKMNLDNLSGCGVHSRVFELRTMTFRSSILFVFVVVVNTLHLFYILHFFFSNIFAINVIIHSFLF